MTTSGTEKNQSVFDKTLAGLYALQGLGIRPGLERIRRVLDSMGNPHLAYPTAVVAGTNGKGSASAMLTSILARVGCTTGLYTSPHLERFNERIRIGLEPAADEDVVRAFEAVEAACRGVPEKDRPTFFETVTAMAFHHFRERSVGLAVLEVGMGGRFDATNVTTPRVAVITSIGTDHAACLGSTPAEVAREKAGVIGEGSVVVTGVRGGPALEVISEVTEERNGLLMVPGRDFDAVPGEGNTFDYTGPGWTLRGVRPGLRGRHQVENAACALAAAEALARGGFAVTEEAASEGLAETRWPGRFETFPGPPRVVLDCAHNPEGARALAETLRREGYEREKLVLVLGVMADKDYVAIARELSPLARKVILAAPAVDRSADPSLVEAEAKRHCDDTIVAGSVAGALRSALGDAGPDGAVCVAGSVFTVGEAKSALADLT